MQALWHRASRCARFGLLGVCLIVLGFAAAYASSAAGSRAATSATTTAPKPDPPPTTTRVVQPPPPPPPTQTYVAPPPPPAPAVQSTGKIKAPGVVPKRPAARPKRHLRTLPTKAPPRPTRRPDRLRGAASVAAIGPSSSGAPAYLVLLLALALSLLALVAAAALAPAKALPQSVFDLLDGRREVLISASAALAVGIAAGLVVVALS